MRGLRAHPAPLKTRAVDTQGYFTEVWERFFATDRRERVSAALAAIPTTWTKRDEGREFHAADYAHTFRWDGDSWGWAEDDVLRPGALVQFDSAPGTGWTACNGATVSRCKPAGDGTTESYTVPTAAGWYMRL